MQLPGRRSPPKPRSAGQGRSGSTGLVPRRNTPPAWLPSQQQVTLDGLQLLSIWGISTGTG